MTFKTLLQHLAKELLDMSNVTATFPITTIDTDTTSTITAVHYTDATGTDVTLPVTADTLAAITPKAGDLVILFDDGGFSISSPETVPVVPPVTQTVVAADLPTLGTGTVVTASGVSIVTPFTGATVTLIDTDITGSFIYTAAPSAA